MPIEKFPDPRGATEEGIVAIGGDLHPESLILAYSSGIFPWPISDLPLTWFCPPERAVLFLDNLRVSSRLARYRRSSDLRFTVDQDFDSVIAHCATVPRRVEEGFSTDTWITPDMAAAYRELHALGHAHSVEAWRDDELVGGVYGVESDGTFACESMFFREPNASKLAFLRLCDVVAARGGEWLDIQMMTPHMARLGAQTISRERFLKLLAETRAAGRSLFPRHHTGS